jgi:hypothetical protein
LETLNPAKSMIASLGIGIQADSRTISPNTAGSPVEPMNSVAALITGLRTTSVAEARRYMALEPTLPGDS